MVKQTKMIHNPNESNWQNIPIVILKKELLQQDWFTGEAHFSNTNSSDNKDTQLKKNFSTNNLPPYCLFIKQPYENQTIEINITWNEECTYPSARYELTLEYPLVDDYSTEDGMRKKVFGSVFLEVILLRIKQALSDSLPKIDTIMKQRKREEREKIARELHKIKLQDELEVHLDFNDAYTNIYIYGEDRTYAMAFNRCKISEKGAFFSIETIHGKFTTNEIKQIIQIVGGNPRAVADRLTGKKRDR